MDTIKIIIDEYDGIDRFKEPVTLGIPFPKAVLFDISVISLHDKKNKRIGFQKNVLSTWNDGSIKWLLLDFVVSINAYSRNSYILSLNKKACDQTDYCPVEIRKEKKTWQINTGVVVFHIDTIQFRPFSKLLLNGENILSNDKSNILIRDENDLGCQPLIKKIEIETRGPLRTAIRIDGIFHSRRPLPFLEFTARLTFYTDSALCKCCFTIRNTKAAKHLGGLWDLGDPGSFLFNDLSFYLCLKEDEYTVQWKPQIKSNINNDHSERVEIYQDSSGGENWDSLNHVNRFNKVMHSFKGYRVKNNNGIIEKGVRINPEISLSKNNANISVTVQKFWQNFPKSIEANKNELIVRLFPNQYNDLFELQGGEQKTHTIFYDFLNTRRLDWVQHPLVPHLEPEYYARTNVFSYLVPDKNDQENEMQTMIESAIKGTNTFFDRREVIDEYGWRNYGDLFADHETMEQLNYNNDKPLISHYNNQYDVIYGMLYQFVRSGNVKWFELARELATHVMDIDIYHTESDISQYNKGLHWHTDHFVGAETATHRSTSIQTKRKKNLKNYGAGPDFDQLYTRGLLVYYYLTGEESAKETMLDLVNWCLVGIDNKISITQYFENKLKNMVAYFKKKIGIDNSLAIYMFDGPGRTSGNCLETLIDAFELTKNVTFLKKADKLIVQCISPHDDIDKRNLLNPNFRWMYTIFLQALGNYLDKKSECEDYDIMFNYARDSLLKYAKWMSNKESLFLEKKKSLDAPNFATRCAQDLRKSLVFLYAFKYSNNYLRYEFLKKAHYYYEKSISFLESFPTKTTTRPLAILMKQGTMYSYFKKTNSNLFEHNLTQKNSNYKKIEKKYKTSETRRLISILRNTSIKKELYDLTYRINNIIHA